jgi:KDO2-lipid IV(A) lauroyltransferase
VTYAKRLDRPLQFEVGLAAAFDPREPNEHGESVQTLTQWYNDQLEQVVRSTPDQYWWLHRRWKGRPPPAVARRLAARHSSRVAA